MHSIQASPSSVNPLTLDALNAQPRGLQYGPARRVRTACPHCQRMQITVEQYNGFSYARWFEPVRGGALATSCPNCNR